jgi:hypothetical protein
MIWLPSQLRNALSTGWPAGVRRGQGRNSSSANKTLWPQKTAEKLVQQEQASVSNL